MANLSFTSTASLSIKGITPTDGPTSVVSDSGSYSSGATEAGDRITRTFTVNAGTPLTAIDLGKITSGKMLWLECNGSLTVELTQDFGSGDVANIALVNKFFMLQSPFTALRIANPGGTAINVSVMVAGDRDAVGAGPGVF